MLIDNNYQIMAPPKLMPSAFSSASASASGSGLYAVASMLSSGDVYAPESLALTVLPSALKSPALLFRPILSGTIPPKLMQAAEAAYQKHHRVSGACEATANSLHRLLLGQPKLSVRHLPKAQGLQENGKPLSYLKTLLDENRLTPGMVIFINTDPKMSMSHLSPSNRHWFTYLGLDPESNKPVFCDQYGAKRSLEAMLRLKKAKEPDASGATERKIHTIFDPYRDQPGLLG